MLSFSFCTEVADLDSTVEGELDDPSLVLVLELEGRLVRVTVPDDVLKGRRELLAIGDTVKVSGEMKDGRYRVEHVATDLVLEKQLH
jgi:hypothetical protein